MAVTNIPGELRPEARKMRTVRWWMLPWGEHRFAGQGGRILLPRGPRSRRDLPGKRQGGAQGAAALAIVTASLGMLMTTGLSDTAKAADHSADRQFIQEQLHQERLPPGGLQAPDFLKPPPPPGPQEQAFVDKQVQLRHQSRTPDVPPPAGALVFVSFSMPPDELKERVREAVALNIPVLIRGMINDDMRATATTVARLLRESGGGGIRIDPLSFRQYNVTTVPVLIVTCGSQGETVDRLEGDLMLRQALRRVARDGECAATARELLGEEKW